MRSWQSGQEEYRTVIGAMDGVVGFIISNAYPVLAERARSRTDSCGSALYIITTYTYSV